MRCSPFESESWVTDNLAKARCGLFSILSVPNGRFFFGYILRKAACLSVGKVPVASRLASLDSPLGWGPEVHWTPHWHRVPLKPPRLPGPLNA